MRQEDDGSVLRIYLKVEAGMYFTSIDARNMFRENDEIDEIFVFVFMELGGASYFISSFSRHVFRVER